MKDKTMGTGFTIETDEKSGHFRLSGMLDIFHEKQARSKFQSLQEGGTADASALTRLDTAGAMLLHEMQEQYQFKIQHLKAEHKTLFAMVSKMDIAAPALPKEAPVIRRNIVALGAQAVGLTKAAAEFTEFLGHACAVFMRYLFKPRHWRFLDIMHHIEETGIKAIPIISVMAFMIAIVVAYQGIAQLQPIGAERLTVNLVSISVLREMGVLLTAIMVAGRSGSAFAAQIGVMKVREEIDALQVIGISPFEVLVMPRLIALIITLPLLTFIADMMGLFGGGVISMLLLDIPPDTYLQHVQAVASGTDFMVGMIKAPVFALLIAIVGCMHGMKVSGSAESVGNETTSAVVETIFLVLVTDAFFSILFEKMGI